MLLAKLDIKNKLVLIFQEGMNKKNKKKEVKKNRCKKNRFFASLCMGRRSEKTTIRSVNHVFWAYSNHSLSDIYIGNILGYLYIGQIVLPSRTKIQAQNKLRQNRFLSLLRL